MIARFCCVDSGGEVLDNEVSFSVAGGLEAGSGEAFSEFMIKER